MRKIKFIINPVAGKGEAIEVINKIDEFMKCEEINYSISISKYKGHIEEISKKSVLNGYTDIIAVGGDGTVIETFNGLVNSEVALGVIPAGTGNDFVKMLNINSNLLETLNKIIIGKTKLIDVGVVNDSYFLNVVGFGIDGDIVEKTEKVKKIIKGSAAYIYSTFSVLLKYKCRNINLNIDGKIIKRKVYLVAIGNGKYFGGGMMIAPGAKFDSENFEIIILKKIPVLKFMILFSKVFKGKHIYEKSVEVFYGKNITINSDVPLKINADGNIIGVTPATVKIYSKKQKVII